MPEQQIDPLVIHGDAADKQSKKRLEEGKLLHDNARAFWANGAYFTSVKTWIKAQFALNPLRSLAASLFIAWAGVFLFNYTAPPIHPLKTGLAGTSFEKYAGWQKVKAFFAVWWYSADGKVRVNWRAGLRTGSARPPSRTVQHEKCPRPAGDPSPQAAAPSPRPTRRT